MAAVSVLRTTFSPKSTGQSSFSPWSQDPLASPYQSNPAATPRARPSCLGRGQRLGRPRGPRALTGVPSLGSGAQPRAEVNLTLALGEASQQMVWEPQREKEAHPEQSQAAFTSSSRQGWQIRAMLAVRTITGEILGTLCGWVGGKRVPGATVARWYIISGGSAAPHAVLFKGLPATCVYTGWPKMTLTWAERQ
ncbi:hypothetical protein HJG60_007825 [Phyllostomus discolor]|uniref:Uncharacterized protein n=1 Tax=Phyllostomus discolor TaxID=89673 RepID=A0A834EY70_9CHIR|nr:hypothetical protein HJG60_007825 [Phyllostomus discolor]